MYKKTLYIIKTENYILEFKCNDIVTIDNSPYGTHDEDIYAEYLKVGDCLKCEECQPYEVVETIEVR